MSSASSEKPHGTLSVTLHAAGAEPLDGLLNSSQLAAFLLGLLAKRKHSTPPVGVTSSVQGVHPILAGRQTPQANYQACGFQLIMPMISMQQFLSHIDITLSEKLS